MIAIPAKDEGERIGACLAALAMQRDEAGAPLPAGTFAVLVYANNCRDDTVAKAERLALDSPHPIMVIAEASPADRATAGHARRRAMDLAAEHLTRDGLGAGVILTTDADSCASATWIHATLKAFEQGVDGVAGYVDADPAEIVGLGPALLRRSRLEDRYLRILAEIDAICDPRDHDPWPTHRMSSGASLAVTLDAYRAIGGLPEVAVGEDAALTRALERHGFKVRHAMDVVVSTSCRFEGRARGGAADTIRLRHADPEAPCDDDMADARSALRRAVIKGRLRRAAEGSVTPRRGLAARLGLDAGALRSLAESMTQSSFAEGWEEIAATSPALSPTRVLRPNDLPREIARGEAILRRLHRWRLANKPLQPINTVVQDNAIVIPRESQRGEGIGRLRAAQRIVGLSEPVAKDDLAARALRVETAGGSLG